MNIGYAEDDGAVRGLTAFHLERLEHTVIAVEDGAELLEQLESGKGCDVVITDNNMPKVTGIEALRQLRASPRFKHLPVIVLSGDWQIKGEVEKLGGIFVEKGSTFKDLDDALERVALMLERRKG